MEGFTQELFREFGPSAAALVSSGTVVWLNRRNKSDILKSKNH